VEIYFHIHRRFTKWAGCGNGFSQAVQNGNGFSHAVKKQPSVMLDIFILLNIYIYIDIGTTKSYWMVFKYSNMQFKYFIHTFIYIKVSCSQI
jgi:hypothetical protein